MMKVRMKGAFGEVEVEAEPKNLRGIGGNLKIVDDDALEKAIKAYKALAETETKNDQSNA